MDFVSQLLTLASAGGAGGGPTAPLTEPLLFPTSQNSSGYSFIHGVKTDGTVVGSYNIPTNTVYHAYFYNPFLVVQGSGQSTAYVINCNDMSLYGTIYGVSPAGAAPWSSDGKYVYVDAVSNQLDIIDIPNLSVTSTAYTADDGYGGRATDHMTVGFANHGSGLFSSVQNRYWWSIGDSAGIFPVYYYYADKTSSTTLGTKSQGYGPGNNYSRTWGLTFNQTYAMFCNIGSNFFTVSSTASSAQTISPSALSYGGYSYQANLDSTDAMVRCGTTTGAFYVMNRAYASTYDYRYRIAYYPSFASGGTTPYDCGIDLKAKTTSSSGAYYYAQDGTFMCQINDNGYVAVAYYDSATYGTDTNQLVIKILNGSSTVATNTTTVPSAYTGGASGTFTRNAINGSSWTTNLLYSGSQYS